MLYYASLPMEHEPHLAPTHLTGIHLNFEEHAIEFEDQHGTVGRLRFTGETVLYEAHPLLLTPTPPPAPAPAAAPLPAAPRPRPHEPARRCPHPPRARHHRTR